MLQQLVAAVGVLFAVAGAIASLAPIPVLMTRRQFYELPAFVAGILARQPLPPRRVPVRRVIRALLGGVDCLIYFGGGLFFIGFGLVFGSSPDTIWGGIGFLIVGLLTLSLGLFRIWQVERALRLGDAELAEVTEAQRGRARLTGTPWGDLMTGVAARGGYRLENTGETGRYYMQQAWALSLLPSARIWILRRSGRDVLYAPAAPAAN